MVVVGKDMAETTSTDTNGGTSLDDHQDPVTNLLTDIKDLIGEDTGDGDEKHDQDGPHRFCFGSTRRNGYDITWYTPKGKSARDDTRCEFCKLHVVDMECIKFDKERYIREQCGSHASEYDIQREFGGFNCDSAIQRELFTMNYGGFDIRVLPTEFKRTPCYLVREHRNKASKGVGIFGLPTHTPYKIAINLSDDNAVDIRYTVDVCTVGGKKVIINDGELIYFMNRYDIETMKTGSKESFLFYAPSKFEQSVETTPGLNESNIITLKLSRYRRIPPISTYNNYDSYGSTSKGSGSSRGRPRGLGNHSGSDMSGFRCKGIGGPLSGGATVSGDRHVSNVSTVNTNATFKLLSTTDITLQLLCIQDEEEKFKDNMIVRLRKERELRTKCKRMFAALAPLLPELQQEQLRNAPLMDTLMKIKRRECDSETAMGEKPLMTHDQQKQMLVNV